MNIRVIVAGKPALGYAKSGVGEYLKRLGRTGDHEWIVVKPGSSGEVSRRLLERSEGCHRVALDERGKLLSTREFHRKMGEWSARGDIKSVAFLIGAADGHTDELRAKCQFLLALSPMTMQHELALIVLLEQLYRIACISSGSPYHRD